MGELYQVSVKTVNEHLVNIYNEGELAPQATIRKFRIVQTEGARRVSRMVDHYNLDAILAVGYRVRSTRGTAFRQWATARLREYIVKGFTLDSYIKYYRGRRGYPPACPFMALIVYDLLIVEKVIMLLIGYQWRWRAGKKDPQTSESLGCKKGKTATQSHLSACGHTQAGREA